MRLIELHENRKVYLDAALVEDSLGLSFQTTVSKISHAAAARTEEELQARLAQGSIGWSEPLKFGISDADRSYQPVGSWRPWDTFEAGAEWPREGPRYALAAREGWDGAAAAVGRLAAEELERLDREFDGQAMTGVLRDFVELLEALR